ncbi:MULTISPECIES: response regulator transcription factor [Bacillus]|jgi:DNA-binding response OmpR family regulator|uniref:response regulator transcription factor n=1 Tax=Bacillus TaxID=1386 RepID=UPI00035E67BE|nr:MULTISPECIES: response regulator transcription factor [Bacillus]MBD5797385.1 DNA-binding response regulator [Bacillus pseudomycoides]MED1478344.1 response regulator transcription factor [Bacillus pseudomycoides]MED1625265.1 response regulator transcription factor [Bacillus pseudomycoides]PEO89652.1 DNA-binding response regulator [Bacillus pseudomycoides]PGE00066.1 DNA-binding response regulator [Bacillus pseudomycoides]
MTTRIAIIEDEDNIREICKRYLESEGYEVYTAENGEEGWNLFQQYQPDLIVLDLMMPKKDGWELCEEIRQHSNVPIIILTARAEERDRILGLTIGADDYVTKPFSPRELVLRVQILLRRGNQATIQMQEPVSEIIRFQDLDIHPAKRRVFVCGHEIELTVKEFEVLHIMAKHPRQVFSRSQLLEQIWDFEYEGCTNTVTVLVSRLREKLEKHTTKNRWIHTVWGIGYRFDPDGGNEL